MFTERAHFEFSHGLLPRSSSEPKRVSQGFSHGWPQARAHAYMYKLVELEVAQAVTAAQISSHAICVKITGFVFLTDLVVFGHRIAQKLQKKSTAPTAIPSFSASFRETSQRAKPVFIYIIAKQSQGQIKEVKVQSQSVVAGQL